MIEPRELESDEGRDLWDTITVTTVATLTRGAAHQ